MRKFVFFMKKFENTHQRILEWQNSGLLFRVWFPAWRFAKSNVLARCDAAIIIWLCLFDEPLTTDFSRRPKGSTGGLLVYDLRIPAKAFRIFFERYKPQVITSYFEAFYYSRISLSSIVQDSSNGTALVSMTKSSGQLMTASYFSRPWNSSTTRLLSSSIWS